MVVHQRRERKRLIPVKETIAPSIASDCSCWAAGASEDPNHPGRNPRGSWASPAESLIFFSSSFSFLYSHTFLPFCTQVSPVIPFHTLFKPLLRSCLFCTPYHSKAGPSATVLTRGRFGSTLTFHLHRERRSCVSAMSSVFCRRLTTGTWASTRAVSWKKTAGRPVCPSKE